ncbi:MAG: hypothetical protein U9R19_02460 [Bacteroidota bacterium]|nr:hypothetical protein [Bacteroidota bacterium]
MGQISAKKIEGKLINGQTYTGKLMKFQSEKLRFGLSLSKFHKKPLGTFVKQFNRRTKHETKIAWSGISVIDETSANEKQLSNFFVGSPLGFIIADGIVLNPPLYNKPALLLNNEGKIFIKNVSTQNGIRVLCRSHKIDIPPENRNIDGEKHILPDFCFYDLLYEKDYIYADGRVIVQLAGNIIKEIIFSKPGQKIPIQTIGLTLSVADEAFPPTWDMRERELEIKIKGFENIRQGIETGSFIVQHGKVNIKLNSETWQFNQNRSKISEEKTNVDCPGIAIGFDIDNNLIIITIVDVHGNPQNISLENMAKILIENNTSDAVSFTNDWQGSLILGDEIIVDSSQKEAEAQNETFPVSCAVMGYFN